MPTNYTEKVLENDDDATDAIKVEGEFFVTIWNETANAFTGTIRLQQSYYDKEAEPGPWRNIINSDEAGSDKFKWNSPMDVIQIAEMGGVRVKAVLETAGGTDVRVRLAQGRRT